MWAKLLVTACGVPDMVVERFKCPAPASSSSFVLRSANRRRACSTKGMRCTKGLRSSAAPISACDRILVVAFRASMALGFRAYPRRRACSTKGVRCMKGRRSNAAPISACNRGFGVG